MRVVIKILSLMLFTISTAVNAGHNVLFIHSYDTQHKWTQFITEGFEQQLKSEKDVNVFNEYMDTKRFSVEEHQDSFYKHLLDKYSTHDLSAVVVSDDPAMNLMLRHQNDSFHQVPVIYMGVNKVKEEILNRKGMTGVFENRDLEATMVGIKEIFRSEKLVVISDTSSTGKANLSKIYGAMDNPRVPQDIRIISPLLTSEIHEVFASISHDTPVLIVGQLIDVKNNNALMKWTEGVALLSEQVDNPLISIGVISLAHGALAAHELNGQQHAAKAAKLLVKILHGVPVDRVKPITKETSQWYWNWQKMKEHKISPDLLPENALLMFKDEPFYREHPLIFAGGAVSLFVALIIIALLLELVRRSKQTQKILAVNEARYKDLAQEGASIFWETEKSGKISYISGDTLRMLYLSNQQILDQSAYELFRNSRYIHFPSHELLKKTEKKQPIKNMIARVDMPGQAQLIFSMSGKPLVDEQGVFNGYRGIIKEVTSEFQLTEKVAYEASHDSLTGLINRREFNDYCKRLEHEGFSSGKPAYICFLDLDRFKMVNDTIGHLAGDGMLAEIASLIKESVNSAGILGRLGGDEFGLIFQDISRQEVLRKCNAIIEQVEKYRFYWQDTYYTVGASIGVVKTQPLLSSEELLSRADMACYKAKELGKGRVYFSGTDDSELQNEQLQLGYIANIANALESNRFFLAKQLIKPLGNNDGKPHYELLLRYNDVNGEPVSPGLFIPAAEKYGVITLIDKWVIEKVLTSYHELFPDENPVVSINLSGVSLSNDSFLSDVLQFIKDSDFEMENICFEVTETAVVSHINRAVRFINELKKYGCQFSLDDFGSGASSFGYLKSLPVDYLKIDGSLIHSISSESIDQSIVKSINEIAHKMGMKTIAEFVENQEIVEVLNEIGVDYGQGFGIHRPEPCLKENS